jgi:arylsulfate sulfotransferase
MKSLSVPRAILLVAVSIACACTAGCGAGSDVPPAPVVSVSSTRNPLVAQFNVAMGCAGMAMVEFGADTSYGGSTSWYPVPGGYTLTPILVAGMKASTTYHMRAQSQCAGNADTSGDTTFATGALPTTASFPKLTVVRPNPSLSSQENPGIEPINVINIAVPPTTDMIQALFTDRDANPIWYYDVGPGRFPYTIKPLPNGHIVISITQPNSNVPTNLREVDLAGNTIREMNASELGAKMQAAGFDFVPNAYHHDILPLANGHLIVLTNFTKPFTDLPGYPGTTNVIGDGLIDLDENWNPVWAWNSFDYFNVNRHLFGLPDWTHGNGLTYSPGDGNIIFSMRNESTIVKIDYNNGAGTGNVIWYLGCQSDQLAANGSGPGFSLSANGIPTVDPTLWFSAQHFPNVINQNLPQTTMAVLG